MTDYPASLRPGLAGAPVDLYLYPKSDNPNDPQFPSVIVAEWKSNTLTTRERAMIWFMGTITDKPDWALKLHDPDIVAKWRAELDSFVHAAHATNKQPLNRGFSDTMWNVAIQELIQKAALFTTTGIVAVCDGAAAAFKSDSAVTEDLRKRLQQAVRPLEDVPEADKDWHPGSDGKVLDLVHPSLWPLVYGKTRVLLDQELSLDNCLRAFASGKVIPDAVIQTPAPQPNSWVPPFERVVSKRFQWLPAQVSVEDGRATFQSYINNLHPKRHPDLYRVLEELLTAALPQLQATYERVISWGTLAEEDVWARTRIQCTGPNRDCLIPSYCAVRGCLAYYREGKEEEEEDTESANNPEEEDVEMSWGDGSDDENYEESSDASDRSDSDTNEIGDTEDIVVDELLNDDDEEVVAAVTEGINRAKLEIAASEMSSGDDSQDEDYEDPVSSDGSSGSDTSQNSSDDELGNDVQVLLDHLMNDENPAAAEAAAEGVCRAIVEEPLDEAAAASYNETPPEPTPEELKIREEALAAVAARTGDAEYELDEVWFNITHAVVQPEPDVNKTLKIGELPTGRSTCFDGKKLQVIVKLANIELAPDKPTYNGGSWHVEGQFNERICATALYYYDSDNVTESRLGFRTPAEAEGFSEGTFEYEQGDHTPFAEIFDVDPATDSDDGCLIDVGDVVTKQGRLLTFPNVYQHRVSPFELVDKTRKGHRKIVAFFLVDPHTPVISTANVPPQQMHWGAVSELQKRLPAEIQNQVYSELGCPFTLDEAKKIREELIEERKELDENSSEFVQGQGWNFCEH